MTISEMHNEFNLEMDKTKSNSSPDFEPEEIDLWLNKAQDELIERKAYGNNTRREGLEQTQKRTDDLKEIIKNYSLVTSAITSVTDNLPNAIFVPLPSDYRHAIQEHCTINYTDCNDATVTAQTDVLPTTHDKYNKVRRDPFNKPATSTVLRVSYQKNAGVNNFELIADGVFTISNYNLRYLRDPQQMRYGTVYSVPTTDVDCELSTVVQREIIKLAATRALSNIESQRTQISNAELNSIE